MAYGQRDWLANAVKLFMAHPKLALLGGFRGRMDFGNNKRSSQVDGPKFGTRATYIPSVRCCLPVTHTDPTTRLPFMFMYKVCSRPLSHSLTPSSSALANLLRGCRACRG